ncbi:MAG TPA: hypothetical protein VJY62_04460, partial [Bacteroidia bacterium]|nr:hypothetical protein [Bacteroidia bacterium]
FLRPIIDNFYYLKETSPFLSPLYIVGALTPFFIMYSIYKNKKPYRSNIDTLFKIWGFIILVGIIMMGTYDLFSINYWDTILKISFPVYLYFFTRYFIRSRQDLEGILQTFLYSSVFIVGIFLYEIIAHPIAIGYSRGQERLQGSYADLFNYATYASLCTLICFYFLLKSGSNVSLTKRVWLVAITLVISVSMLIKMSHVASYIVFLSLNILYLLVAFKKNAAGALIFVSIFALAGYMYGKETIDRRFMPLIESDISVYEGESDQAHLLHGRYGRWERYLDVFNNSSSFIQLFGFPVGVPKPYLYIKVAPHNDYIRILFCTGYVGLVFYLMILFNIFQRVIVTKIDILYLGLGSLASLALYSISTVPTIYISFQYIIMSVFAYFAIPAKARRLQENASQHKGVM